MRALLISILLVGCHRELNKVSCAEDPSLCAADAATAETEPDADSGAVLVDSATDSASEAADTCECAPGETVAVTGTCPGVLEKKTKNYIPVKTKQKEHEKALRYKTTTYGSVKGFGDASWSKIAAKSEAVATTVFGLTVTVHKKIVPAIKCAEAEIKATCGATPYSPKALSGLRDKNTYRAGEVTNHLWGIALDIDPLLNSCCGCVKKWQQSPLCKKKAKDIFERMSMPKCWVDAFEKYGFYWLGHDVLKDTMHFEFLADPDQIMTSPASKPIAMNP